MWDNITTLSWRWQLCQQLLMARPAAPQLHGYLLHTLSLSIWTELGFTTSDALLALQPDRPPVLSTDAAGQMKRES